MGILQFHFSYGTQKKTCAGNFPQIEKNRPRHRFSAKLGQGLLAMRRWWTTIFWGARTSQSGRNCRACFFGAFILFSFFPYGTVQTTPRLFRPRKECWREVRCLAGEARRRRDFGFRKTKSMQLSILRRLVKFQRPTPCIEKVMAI